MPETIKLADGTEKEVPTQEELDALNDKATKYDDVAPKLEKLGGDFDFDSLPQTLEEKEKLSKELEELKENLDPQARNFGELRSKTKRLEMALKDKGIELDNEGNVVEKPDYLSKEEAAEMAKKTASETYIDIEKNRLLNQIENKEKRELTQHYYDKLTAGEAVSVENLHEFMRNASKIVGDVEINPSVNTLSGKPPKTEEDQRKDFSDTDEGDKMRQEIFGNDSNNNLNKE